MKTLTDCLKDIGEEEVSICFDGKHIVCSRTEATARKLFLMAHGGVEETTDPEGQIIKIFHKGDPKLCKMIREYTEGRPATEIQPEISKGRKPGSFNSLVSRRLNDRLGLKRPRTSKSKGNKDE